MYRNLYKSNWVVEDEETCVIDSNESLAAHIDALEEARQHRLHTLAVLNGEEEDPEEGEDDFQGGLGGEVIENAGADDDASPIIKAQEEPAGPTADELRAEAEEILAQAQADAEQMQKKAKSEAEQTKKHILEEARTAGYKEGLANAKAEVDAQKAELEKERQRLSEEYERKIADLEPMFVDTITDVYRHIFDVDFSANQDVLLHLIESTMRQVESSKVYIVHVSKEDFPTVSMQKKALSENGAAGRGTVDVIEDISLRKNECMIETDGGIFDCGLGTELDELTKKLKLLSYEKQSPE